jgi:hypothetical protein
LNEDEHSLQLEWLRDLPGYRELIRQRVDEARREQIERVRRIDLAHTKQLGLQRDYLGREVEGCG